MTFATADLVDAHSALIRSCPVQFHQYGGRRHFFGPVRTIRTFEDNALVKRTLSEPGAGAVLVIDGAASLRCALVGDVIAGIGQKNGWSGLVVWGAIRDTVALGGLDIGVKALGSNPWRALKQGSGEVDVAINFGGVEFRKGDWLYSDEDGIVVAERKL